MLEPWYARNVGDQWMRLRHRLSEILEKDAELQEVVQLIGPDALQAQDRLVLETSRMLRDGFLQQSAMSAADATCSLNKQRGMLELMLSLHDRALGALAKGVELNSVLALPIREDIARLREIPEDDFAAAREELAARLAQAFEQIEAQELTK
jgi:V/A-type H+-transporting ATPase subunit A